MECKRNSIATQVLAGEREEIKSRRENRSLPHVIGQREIYVPCQPNIWKACSLMEGCP